MCLVPTVTLVWSQRAMGPNLGSSCNCRTYGTNTHWRRNETTDLLPILIISITALDPETPLIIPPAFRIYINIDNSSQNSLTNPHNTILEPLQLNSAL